MIRNRQKQKTAAKQKKLDHQTRPSELTFLEHFYELRTRLFWVVITLVVASAIGFQFKDQLISVVMAPLHGEKLIYLTPAGGFSFIFTLSIYFGALLSIPAVVYHIYRFLQPLLGGASRRLVALMMFFSILLAAGGAAFGYFVTIPAAINFLTNFAGDAVTPSLTAESYLNFVVMYVLGLAALFQLPLLLFMFDHIKPIPPGMLSSTQRFVIIGATIVAAIITPTPDAVNMMIVAIPIVLIYEVGALIVFIRRRLSSRKPVAARAKPIAQRPKQESQSDFLFDDEIELDFSSPVVQVVQESPKPVRTIDGVIVRKPAASVTVPTRPATPDRPAMQRITSPRPVRSVDGFQLFNRVSGKAV